MKIIQDENVHWSYPEIIVYLQNKHEKYELKTSPFQNDEKLKITWCYVLSFIKNNNKVNKV